MLRTVLLFLCTVESLVCATSSATDQSGSAFQLDFSLEEFSSREFSRSNRIFRRDNTSTVAAEAIDKFYALTVNASLGTPAQPLKLWAITDVGDTEILSSSNPECSPFCKYGTFNPNASSTDVINSLAVYNTTYTDGTSAIGVYMTDTFRIGNTSISNFQFALNQNSSSKGYPANVLGIGYTQLQAGGSKLSYANLPLRLYNDRVTNIVGYSIWFDGPNTTSGKIAFGAVDTGKFSGQLETFPIQLASSTALSYTYTSVGMTSMAASKSGVITNFTGAAISLDLTTGGRSLKIPSSLFLQMVSTIGAVVDRSLNLPVIRLSDYTNDTTLMFTFGGTTIRMPLDDLSATVNASYIAFLIAPTTGYSSIGIPFFRHAYVVYDFSHNQISLAPLVSSSASNVTMISPNGVAGLVSTAQVTDKPGVDPKPGPSTSPTPSPTSGGLTTASKIGIGVGVGLGVPVIIAIIAGIFFLKKRKRNEHSAPMISEVVNTPDYGPPKTSMSTVTSPRYDTHSRNFEPSELSTSTPPPYGGSLVHGSQRS